MGNPSVPDPKAQLSSQEKRELLAQLLRQKAIAESTAQIPVAAYQFDQSPEYQQLKQQQAQVEALGIRNPYFTVHEGIAADTSTVAGRDLINYATYNYLGLSGNAAVSEAAKEAIDRYGTSVSASRPASGERPLHLELEQGIANFIGVEDALVYVAGFTTNVTTIGHLFGRNDLILYDILSHNSVLQGCQLSGAKAIAFSHNDVAALGKILADQRYRYQRVLIVIEGVYSADGDIPNLPEFIALKQDYKAYLMVDEAHSIGVLGNHGRGIGEHFGVDPQDVDLWMGTLSKSFASCGGYIAGSHALVEYLKCTSPGYIYSIGMSPPNAASSLAALKILKAEPERVTQLHQRSQLFLELAREKGLDTGMSQGSAVIPLIVGESFHALRLCHALYHQGINVQPMIYPVVPKNAARLRFFMSCLHTEEQIRFTIDRIAAEVAKLPAPEAQPQRL